MHEEAPVRFTGRALLYAFARRLSRGPNGWKTIHSGDLNHSELIFPALDDARAPSSVVVPDWPDSQAWEFAVETLFTTIRYPILLCSRLRCLVERIARREDVGPRVNARRVEDERRDRNASWASDKGKPGESRRRKATEATAQNTAPCQSSSRLVL